MPDGLSYNWCHSGSINKIYFQDLFPFPTNFRLRGIFWNEGPLFRGLHVTPAGCQAPTILSWSSPRFLHISYLFRLSQTIIDMERPSSTYRPSVCLEVEDAKHLPSTPLRLRETSVRTNLPNRRTLTLHLAIRSLKISGVNISNVYANMTNLDLRLFRSGGSHEPLLAKLDLDLDLSSPHVRVVGGPSERAGVSRPIHTQTYFSSSKE